MAGLVDEAQDFRPDRAWGALDVAEVEGATVRVHWTDQPYPWHVNDGAEVFVVLSGAVDMHYVSAGETCCVRLLPSDVFRAAPGDSHSAHPVGEARVLVVEKKGSP